MQERHASRDRLYCLQTNETYLLFTGISGDGHQLVVGPSNPDAIALLFDEEGALLEVRHDVLSSSQDLQQEDYEKLYLAHVRHLRSSGNYDVKPVSVRKFSCPDDDIGIQDLPFHLDYDLQRLDSLSASERNEHQRAIEEWTASGKYVLLWGNELSVNREGAVV